MFCLIILSCLPQSCQKDDEAEIPEIRITNPVIIIQYGSVKDTEGNNYKTAQIDTLMWMAENLATTKYNDGTSIPNETGSWSNLTTGAYCWYNHNKETYGNIYGALYNWYAVNTGKLCPIGWHVPSNNEWTTLIKYGSDLKESGNIHWPVEEGIFPNPFTGKKPLIYNDSKNITGFTALPGGCKYYSIDFNFLYKNGMWWSSTETLSNGNCDGGHYFSISATGPPGTLGCRRKSDGYSVRCVKDNTNVTLPIVITNPVTTITKTSATVGGDIIYDGRTSITARGVCWNTTGSPTILDSRTTDGTGVGSFISNMTGLKTSTVYYARAYATNSAGTSYGSHVAFVTGSEGITRPYVTTSLISAITKNTASGGGNVTYDGGANVTARGVCWNTSGSPTILDSKTNDGKGTGSFISNLTGLNEYTHYQVRAYATNSKGTAYGNEVFFSTSTLY